jgi:hypothetical protein
MDFRFARAVPKVVVEDPEGLGYRLAEEPLLAVLSADEWHALEQAALAGPRDAV